MHAESMTNGNKPRLNVMRNCENCFLQTKVFHGSENKKMPPIIQEVSHQLSDSINK